MTETLTKKRAQQDKLAEHYLPKTQKRDGRLVAFSKQNITRAISKAMTETDEASADQADGVTTGASQV